MIHLCILCISLKVLLLHMNSIDSKCVIKNKTKTYFHSLSFQTQTISDLAELETAVRSERTIFSMAASRCLEMCQLQATVQVKKNIVHMIILREFIFTAVFCKIFN